ncbi:glycosyltransferase [Candidatus Saccharibacteria bacterium]|nr:glycosyltransferase [Candidatus Saccharibacteria bacterium]
MRRVKYLVENADGAYFRYRIKNVCEALERSEKWRGGYFCRDEQVDLGGIDILVVGRQTEKGIRLIRLIEKCRKNGIRVLFDLDDLVFDYRDLKMVFDSVREKSVFYWIGYFWGIRRIAKRVDGFLTTNEFLAKKLKRSFKKPVKVIRNSLSEEQVNASLACMKLEREKNKERFTVGYFSGSPTHAKDFQVVEPGLIRFLEKHEDATLKVVGYMRFSKEAEKLVEAGKIWFLPFTDFRKLQRLMAEVDVNIAPLILNDFTNCKSELKFFEAAAVETTTIASPSYTFKKVIKDGENGFLAQQGEWYKKLEYLYEHPEENRKIALAAKKYALENYYGKKFLEEVEEAYEYFGE